jgi:hypothetical protein
VLLCFFLTASVDAAAPTPDQLKAALQPLLTREAAKYNCSYAMAVHMEGLEVSLAAGADDDTKGGPAVKPDSNFVWGSCTKVATGVSIMRLVEEGVLNLFDPISMHVNDYMKQMSVMYNLNYSSVEDLWGDEIAGVTVEHLLNMTSGIPDWDTANPARNGKPAEDPLRAEIFANPNKDFPPYELLAQPWVYQKKLQFPPGHEQYYSSTNFILLGFILAQHAGTKVWDQLDQMALLPPVLQKYMASSTQFANHGAPSNFSDVHGFDRTAYNGHDTHLLPGTDVYNTNGVFAGWTASNIVFDAATAAHFVFDVYGPNYKALNKTTVDEVSGGGRSVHLNPTH